MKNNTKLWIAISLFSTLIAIGVHFYLTSHYFDIKLGTSSNTAICNINSKINCDTVSASKYASLLGSPIALWGALTNMVLLLLILIGGYGFSSQPEKVGRYSFYLSTLSLGASLVMGFISSGILNVYCLFCIAAYVLSTVNFGAQLIWTKPSLKFLASDVKSLFNDSRWVLVTWLTIPAFSLLVNNMILDSKGFGRFNEFMLDSVNQWQSGTVNNFTSQGLHMGPENAKMHIVEFADFRCPHCKHAAPSLKAFANSHPDVRFTFKAFPLDGNCNPSPNLQKGDDISCVLAKSVFCAEKEAQKGWSLMEKIFERQEVFTSNSTTNEELNKLRAELGISSDLQSCLADPQTTEMLKTMAQEGLNAGLKGTPTVYVNGKLLQMGQSVPMLSKAYELLTK